MKKSSKWSFSRGIVAITCLLPLASPALAATVLNPGDISIIQFNSDAPDGFAFVTWVNLDADTVISFSDNSFKGGLTTGAGTWAGTENKTSWTPGVAVAAGSVITGLDSGSGNETFSVGTGSGGRLSGLSASGDQIFAFQGAGWPGATSSETFSGTMVFGINLGNSGWLTTGTADSNRSYLPSELNTTGGNLDVGAFNSADNAYYSGPRTGFATFEEYKAAVLNLSNWTFDDAVSMGFATAPFELSGDPPPPTPEPASLALLGIGVAILVWKKRRS